MRLVLDTNVLVSSILLPKSIPGRIFDLAQLGGSLLFSEVTFAELRSVLQRPKFANYLDETRRERFLGRCRDAAAMVEIIQEIRACRDINDDKFLEVAVNGKSNALVTGDADLLVLGSCEGIPIVTPADYLALINPVAA